MVSPKKTQASPPAFIIPLPYLIWNHYLEPLSALCGIFITLYSPHCFLQFFTPTTSLGSQLTLSTEPLPPLEQLLLTQTLSLYALFVVLEGVLLNWVFTTPKLHSLPEVRMQIFTLVMWACLASDGFYMMSLWGMWRGQGAEELFWSPWLWGRNEWLTLGASWVPFVQRVCFLMGVGVGKGG
ncbi:hypothetical protein BGX38DRAFT_1333041 [Terfezia claveryi]|nr:hypothetical protein BGX38DRAFT_1333041 [Terfezia claveryi]